MTVFGRISLVKSLALSKLTHVVQVIPNPCAGKIKNLQKLINSFVWTGSHCKKVVVRGEISEQPMEQGSLAAHVIKRGILGIKDSRHWGVLPGTFLKNNGNLH